MTGLGRGNWETKHGGARRCGRDPEYTVWHHMLRRCRDPREGSYPDYGGRGIRVCARWHDYGNFIADMGRRPSPEHTLERVDNDGMYDPLNCRWATRTEQAANRRPRRRIEVCARGHTMRGANLYVRANGKRACRACRQKNMADFYERRKKEAASVDA